MKEFSIEAFKNGAQAVTRDGREVQIFHTNLKAAVPGYTVVGIIKYEANDDVVLWTSKGEVVAGEINPRDLMLKSQKCKGWTNIYRTYIPGFVATAGHVFKTPEEAKAAADCGKSYLDTIKIEWEE